MPAPPGATYGPKRATHLYQLAAAWRNSVELMNFGDLYALGVGAERDLGRAALLLCLAFYDGFDWHLHRSQKIKPRMSANDYLRLGRLRAEWPDQHRK